MTRSAAVLIAAQTGRALAQSARACGYTPLVADLFADADTRQVAADTLPVAALDEESLLPAMARLARGRRPLGVVCGTGFEDRPVLLDAIAQHHRIIGNSRASVRAVKDPRSLAEACTRLGVPHPPISLAAAPDDGWLRKRIGGAGGEHITQAVAGAPLEDGYYVQRRVAGQPMSALFLADGERALVLGLSRQWADPARGQPFRYGGAAQPATLPPGQMSALRAGLDGLSRAFALRGLNSADLLARDDGFFLLEINPRPGATLDLFPSLRLFALHVAACNLRLPGSPPREPLPTAAAIVYAPAALTPPPGFAWPDWASDRQAGGVVVAAGQPLCSVRAAGADAEATVRRRAAAIIAAVQDAACRST